MLVVAPTRELAVQTSDFCEATGKRCSPPMRAVCIYGGVPKHTQLAALNAGVHIVIATPGTSVLDASTFGFLFTREDIARVIIIIALGSALATPRVHPLGGVAAYI